MWVWLGADGFVRGDSFEESSAFLWNRSRDASVVCLTASPPPHASRSLSTGAMNSSGTVDIFCSPRTSLFWPPAWIIELSQTSLLHVSS